MKKIEIALADNEVVVVLDKAVFEHIVFAYQCIGAECKDVDEMMAWYGVSDDIKAQIDTQ